MPELEEEDARFGRSKFYVYVLDTEYGYYIGHSGNIEARINAHFADEVPSTAGGNPEMLWRSRPFKKRADATRFEAALKSWRDNRKDKFHEYTGLPPVPFSNPQQHYSQGITWKITVLIVLAIMAILAIVA
ncbi:MAG: GIY-YIG nuclease family protein [Candidatus Dadabacteria bacterium]|nr:GIY-YIG nuclease family protein [Candidatus Dadabacteria bacterium]